MTNLRIAPQPTLPPALPPGVQGQAEHEANQERPPYDTKAQDEYASIDSSMGKTNKGLAAQTHHK